MRITPNESTEILKSTDFLSLRKVVSPEKGVNGYYYSHEDRCNGHIVSILPFRFISDDVYCKPSNEKEIEFLLRHEITPCWNINQHTISSITGGVDKGNTVEETVIIEMKEETGYIVHPINLIDLGVTYGIKSSDTIYHLYAVDLSGMTKGEVTTDGSSLEQNAFCEWKFEVSEAVDPMVYTSFYRLMDKFLSRGLQDVVNRELR
jgi:8-oxo-dGTP pyrophosphatase MutT (NUDIX family)